VFLLLCGEYGPLASRSLLAMPLTYDEVATALAHLTAAQCFPLPARPISKDNAIAMYQVAEGVAHGFLGDGDGPLGQPPWLSGAPEGALNWARDIIALAEPAIRRVESLPSTHKVFRGNVEDNFISTFGAPEGHEAKRPLVKVSYS
jgi:hypothetical protein